MKKIICIENPDWECFTLYISEVETDIIMHKKISVNNSDLHYFNNVEESKKFINRFEKISRTFLACFTRQLTPSKALPGNKMLENAKAPVQIC